MDPRGVEFVNKAFDTLPSESSGLLVGRRNGGSFWCSA
jgi:hypothetical protein